MMCVSVNECSEILKKLEHRDRVECYTDGKRLMVVLNLDGLKRDVAFGILDDVRNNVPKELNGKPVRVHAIGIFDLW